MSRTFSHGPFDFRTMSPAIRFLIAANAAAFLLTWVVGAQVYDLFGLVPVHFFRDRWIWQAATYLFIHGGIAHLLINMFCLWMFAMPIEAQWGSRELMKYYFLCGVGAGLVTSSVMPTMITLQPVRESGSIPSISNAALPLTSIAWNFDPSAVRNATDCDRSSNT